MRRKLAGSVRRRAPLRCHAMQATLPGGLEAKEARIFAVIGLMAVGAVALRVAGVSPVVVFVAAGVAVAGLAWVLGVATEEAGEAAGPRLSALLNATFGNLPEMIIVILAIREGLLDVARASIIGSVIGNVLLILGAALLACGWKNGRRTFDRATAGLNATMLVLGDRRARDPDAVRRHHRHVGRRRSAASRTASR